MLDIKEAIGSFVSSILGFAAFGVIYLITHYICLQYKIDIGYYLGICFGALGAIIGYWVREFIKLKKQTIEKIFNELELKAKKADIQDELNYKIKSANNTFYEHFNQIKNDFHEYNLLFEGVKEQVSKVDQRVAGIEKNVSEIHGWFIYGTIPGGHAIQKKHKKRNG